MRCNNSNYLTLENRTEQKPLLNWFRYLLLLKQTKHFQMLILVLKYRYGQQEYNYKLFLLSKTNYKTQKIIKLKRKIINE